MSKVTTLLPEVDVEQLLGIACMGLILPCTGCKRPLEAPFLLDDDVVVPGWCIPKLEAENNIFPLFFLLADANEPLLRPSIAAWLKLALILGDLLLALLLLEWPTLIATSPIGVEEVNEVTLALSMVFCRVKSHCLFECSSEAIKVWDVCWTQLGKIKPSLNFTL